jgi:hypothetical protein
VIRFLAILLSVMVDFTVPNAGTGKSEDRSLEAKVIDAKHPLRLRHQRSEFLDSAE